MNIIDSTKSKQTDYLQTIDNALSSRHEIAGYLKSIRAARESIGYRYEIVSFLKTVQSDIPAKEISEDGNMAMWIPAILDFHFSNCDSDDRAAILTLAIAQNAELRKSDSKSWNYILVLCMTLLVVFTSLCAYIIPIYAEMFTEFGMKLPSLTLLIFQISDWVGPNAKAIIMIVFGTWMMIAIGKRIRRRLAREHFLVRTWGVFGRGSNSRIIAMCRLLNSLGSLLKIGTPFPEALTIAGRASLSELYVQHAVALAEKWRTNGSLSTIENSTFPALMMDALSPNGFTRGDQTVIADFLRELSTIYSERVRKRKEFVVQLLLPIAVLMIGGTVGLIIIAILAPLIELLGGVSLGKLLLGP